MLYSVQTHTHIWSPVVYVRVFWNPQFDEIVSNRKYEGRLAGILLIQTSLLRRLNRENARYLTYRLHRL